MGGIVALVAGSTRVADDQGGAPSAKETVRVMGHGRGPAPGNVIIATDGGESQKHIQ